MSARARAVNRRLLDTERVGQGCVLASPAFERIARRTLTEDGRRAPALRFGDPRVQALAGALCTTMLAVAASPTRACAPTNQASYDLARLRVKGLITRIPGKNRYRLTGDGLLPSFAPIVTAIFVPTFFMQTDPPNNGLPNRAS